MPKNKTPLCEGGKPLATMKIRRAKNEKKRRMRQAARILRQSRNRE